MPRLQDMIPTKVSSADLENLYKYLECEVLAEYLPGDNSFWPGPEPQNEINTFWELDNGMLVAWHLNAAGTNRYPIAEVNANDSA